MKKPIAFLTICLLTLLSLNTSAQLDVSKHIPGIKYESSYTFDTCTEMEIDFYNKKGKLQMTIPYWAFYHSDFQIINIKHQRGNTVYQTIFDLPNNNALIVLGDEKEVMGSASVLKDNDGRELKTLELKPTDETKTILGFTCQKFTFDAPEFYGEFWITNEVKDLPNDVGILKASKMGKYYPKISAEGFVMEITSFTPKGKQTVMRTTGLKIPRKSHLEIPEDFGVAINKIDYYAY